MTNLTIELPDEVYSDLNEVAKRLNQTPEETTQMALSLLMQFDSIDFALIAIQRMQEEHETTPLPALQEEAELSLEFHPAAMEELQSLEEEDQVEVLSAFIERIVAEEDELDDTLDLVINENETEQVVLSSFDFGDIVYKIGDKVVIYMIGFPPMDDLEEFDFDEEEDEELH